jgi:hypothetical protein
MATAAADSSSSECLLNETSSVEALMRKIASEPSEHKERALQLLARKCIAKQERKALYSPETIRVLSDAVRDGPTYFARLYALESVSWAADDTTDLSNDNVSALRLAAVRAPSREELAALAQSFKSGTASDKDDAVVLCGCLGTLSVHGGLDKLDGGVVNSLVNLLKSGSAFQKHWVAYALSNLACSESIRPSIVSHGGIQSLVALARSGTDDQKQSATVALGNLAVTAALQAEIAQAGGIPVLVTLAQSGTDEQQHFAAFALTMLSINTDNKTKIARKGGIPPLVKLLQADGDDHKRWAANALGNLAFNHEVNREAIGRDGSIPPLVVLLRSGTDEQKQFAAYALANVACDSETNRVAIVNEDGIPPLVELIRSGTDKQKEYAACALGNLASKNSVVRDAINRADVAALLRELTASESPVLAEAGKTALEKVRKVRGLLGKLFQ